MRVGKEGRKNERKRCNVSSCERGGEGGLEGPCEARNVSVCMPSFL